MTTDPTPRPNEGISRTPPPRPNEGISPTPPPAGFSDVTADPTPRPDEGGTPPWLLVAAWAAVSLPLAWGVCMTILGALKLFTS